jgi:soluble lytic murein transglycosylase-like protein
MIIQPEHSNTSSSADQRTNLIRKTAEDFGSLFVSMMIKEMRGGTFESDLIPKSFGQKLYTEMLDEKYAQMISEVSLPSLNNQIVKQLEALENSSDISSLSDIKNQYLSQRFADFRTNNNQQTDISINTLKDKVQQWLPLIEKFSNSFNIDKNLVKAVIAKESAGNQYAVSPAGAKGLMQLMDSTASDLGVTNSFLPEQNIAGGVKYLSQMLSRFKGNEHLALASYNAGPSAVEKYKGVPPYRETQDYVRDVLTYKQMFANNEVR